MDSSIILRGKYTAFFCSCMIHLFAKAAYMFPLYSVTLKTKLSLNFQQVVLLSLMKDLGGSVAFIFGYILKKFLFRMWFIMTVASLVNAVAYVFLWLSVMDFTAIQLRFEHCAVLIFVGACAQGILKFFAMSMLDEFPPSFCKSAYKLLALFSSVGGSSNTLMQVGFFGDGSGSDKSVLFLLGFMPGAVCLFFYHSSKRVQFKLEKERAILIFNRFSNMLNFLAVWTAVVTVAERFLNFNRVYYAVSAVVTIIIAVFLPGVLSVKEDVVLWGKEKESEEEEKEEEPVEEENEGKNNVSKLFHFFIILLTTLVGLGSITSSTDLFPSILESTEHKINAVKIILIFANLSVFLGKRLFSKFEPENPSIFLSLSLFLSFLASFLLAFPFTKSIFFSIQIFSFSKGVQLQLLPLLIIQTFSKKNHLKIFYFLMSSVPLGTYIIKYKIIYFYYYKNDTLGKTNIESFFCQGDDCFKHSFTLIGIINLISIIFYIFIFFLKKKGWN